MDLVSLYTLLGLGGIVAVLLYKVGVHNKEELNRKQLENAELVRKLQDLQSVKIPKLEINIPGVAHAKLPGDIESFGISSKQVLDCKKYPVSPGIPTDILNCVKDVLKEGATRGIDIVNVLKGDVSGIKAGSNIYFVLVGEKTQPKLYSFVSSKEEQS